MILTVCPNPCIDCTIELETLNVGRLNRVENKIESPAGKALNTAVGVSRLKAKAFATGFMFESGGKRICHYLDNEGVQNSFVWNEGRLRVNYKIIDGKSMMTEINDKGDIVGLKQQQELLDIVSSLSSNASVTVISGSLPGGVADDYYYNLCSSVCNNSKIVVDCESDKLLKSLNHGVDLVKPNLFELETVNKEEYKNFSEMISGCCKLIEKGAKMVLLSLGKNGAIITNGTKSYYCKSENVAVNSTVGAGDSMVAAASIGLENGNSQQELLRSAVAAGTASITTQGTNSFSFDKYNEIFEKLCIEEL